MTEQTARQLRGINPGADYQTRLDAAHARVEQCDYVRQVIADRRGAARDDFVTELVHICDQDRTISDPELTSLIQILYLGGYETTSHMIGNGLVALLSNPDQLALLRAEPDRLSNAIDEMLRFDGAISLTIVEATDGAEIDGRPVAPGTTCFGMLTAANHDPTVFPEPSLFDITRPRAGNMAFAGGPHFCLGAAIARLELEMVFSMLVSRFPNMRLAIPGETLRRLPSFHQRAFEKVPILLDP